MVGRPAMQWPQLGPNTLFKGCTRELSLPPSLSSPRQHFVASARNLFAFDDVILPPSFDGNNNASQSESVRCNYAPSSLPLQPVRTLNTPHVTNYHLADSTATNQPTNARAHFRRIIRPLPPSLPTFQMIFSQRFPCGKAGYGTEGEGEGGN